MFHEVLRDIESALKQLADINYALDEALIVAVTDARGVITFANNKFCEISKYTREELLGQTHRVINSGYHPRAFFREMWRTIGHGQIWRGEIRNRAKDGSYYWVDTTIVPLLDDRGKPYKYVSFRIDVTERKRQEDFLRRADKVELAAQLASSIAHEIRNPLAAIKWTLQSLNVQGEDQHHQVELVLSEIDRIDRIVSDFLLLARPSDSTFTIHDVRGLVEAIVQLMRVQARKQGVQVVYAGADHPLLVRGAESQLKQVFINLLKNALEAMPDGGRLEVTAEAAPDGGIRVRFADQGTGIPPELLAKIGEPFFTTKEKGSGLGLMICERIVREHGGRLTIQSQLGVGTEVEVWLPAAA
ncbi:MAG: PAS domain S-box protein [Alicyclobacillus sp.]|nr:PAS domain S-box protein [Alicyclobacillus sp.]